ncbi:hypothetical protein POSPLADRAFT_1041404 [Postia placenta MAD-698-R-SB12]|uniref:Uncharacterized protein n=1 Tax=Postia placenta MAD-698-R-SB12 TaxID=670580 RepID=A0A1X6MQ25_9APHY|nr:hypothetical protein POSPLADRAFT_1041404 [Postia placenta MAD-698-R-SB12]OSX58306.1 hypothetical protein POSPLADRAFT_1041404 [Postia placenta MAD-698-R-SB12]
MNLLLKQDIVARLYEGSESDNRSVCNLESIWDTDKNTPVAVVHLVCSESTQASGAWSYTGGLSAVCGAGSQR